MTHLHLTTDIAVPPEVLFDMVLNADVQVVLDRTTQAVSGVTAGPLRLGDTVTWRARHFGVVWHMTSKIVEVDRPKRFADEMQRGPFASWRHVHTFEPLPWGTRMHDDVHFTAPLGAIGAGFDRFVLGRYMAQLLSTRNRHLKRIAEGGTQKGRQQERLP